MGETKRERKRARNGVGLNQRETASSRESVDNFPGNCLGKHTGRNSRSQPHSLLRCEIYCFSEKLARLHFFEGGSRRRRAGMTEYRRKFFSTCTRRAGDVGLHQARPFVSRTHTHTKKPKSGRKAETKQTNASLSSPGWSTMIHSHYQTRVPID